MAELQAWKNRHRGTLSLRRCPRGNCKQKTSSPTAEEPTALTKIIERSGNNGVEASDASPSWTPLRNLFSCSYQKRETQTMKKKKKKKMVMMMRRRMKSCQKFGCSSVSLCRMRDSSSFSTPEANKKADSKCKFDSSGRSLKAPRNDISGAISTSFSSISSASFTASSSSSGSSSSSLGASFRAMHLRGFSGCFECNVLADPISTDPSIRLSINPCPACGEIFIKPEDLELHLVESHAVSEMEEDDTGRKIVEIIFQSSWLNYPSPRYSKIERILKVQNIEKTIASFEEHRAAIKSRAVKLQAKNSRCIADGNELLRFYSAAASTACSLGLHGSTRLCDSTAECDLCSILHGGFKPDELGRIRTMATGGAAHEAAAVARISSNDEDDGIGDDSQRAMLVCRVIAGRVKKREEAHEEWYDSVDGAAGICGTAADELFVFSPHAVLPCFVVLYRGRLIMY